MKASDLLVACLEREGVEHVRSASEQRLSERIGTAPSATMQQVKDRLRVLMAH